MRLAGDVKQQLTNIMLDPNAEDFEIANQTINGLTENTKQCDYYDSGSIPTFDPATDRLFVLHVNIRSLQKNFGDFYHLLTELNTMQNLICLFETRLKDTSNLRLVNLAKYNIVTSNYSKPNAAGVTMYVSETLEFKVVQNYSINDPNCEDFWIKLRFNNNETLLVCVIYRHPKANIYDFFDKLNNSLTLELPKESIDPFCFVFF